MDNINKLNISTSVIAKQISEVLIKAILMNNLKGGDQLLEEKFQKQFGISRSPLREAFRDLEKQGLVEIIPRKGAFVKRITRRDIEENYAVRILLEGLAAKEAYHNMTGEDHRNLEKALLKMEKAAVKNDTNLYWKNHAVFHEIFINACSNRVVIDILKKLRIHSMWHRFSYPNYDEDLQDSFNYHKRIYKLFISPNTDESKLEDLVKEHIEKALDIFLKNVNLEVPD